MNILYIVNTFPDKNNPAAETFVKTQIDSVRRAGACVSVFNIRGPQSTWNYLSAIVRVRRKYKYESYDIIHGHYVYSGIVAALQCRIPSVVSFMGSDLNGAPNAAGGMQFRGYLDIALSHLLEFFVTGIVVKNNFMQGRLFRPKRSIILPNGVDFKVFYPIDRAIARKKIGIDESGSLRYVLFVGSPSSPLNKGWNIAKKAVEIAKNYSSDIRLINTSGVPHNSMVYFMNAADVLILPSMREGSPNVVKEAMACNLPIISTDVGDVHEIIEGVELCRIVPRDPKAFANAILDIINKGSRTNGRKRIEHLKIERVSQRLIGFYEHIIEKHKACRV